MKRSKKLAILVLVAGLATIAPLSCAKVSTTPTTAGQVVTVQQGQLLVQIPGSGNLAFSNTADLAFQGAGTIDQIYVQAGDSVKKGEVLATLDQLAWQLSLTSLQRTVTAAQHIELSAEISLTNATQTLQQDLNTNPSVGLLAAQTNYLSALNNYQYILNNFGSTAATNAKEQLNSAYAALKALSPTAADSGQITIAMLNLYLAQGKVDDAKNAVSDAQKALDEANAASPEIVAPFDGVVTAVGAVKDPRTGQTVTITGGEVINKGTIGVSIADPTKFKSNVLVNEADIYNVQIGATATVVPIAAPTVTFPATVTAIAPTATVTSGVVNYSVTVDVANQPLSLGSSGIPSASQVPTPTPTSGQNASTPTSSFQLKSGLTATVNILFQNIPDAILIPNRAIARQGTQLVVKVVNADGTTATRVITVGPNTITSTQVLSGLNVGDKVLVP